MANSDFDELRGMLETGFRQGFLSREQANFVIELINEIKGKRFDEVVAHLNKGKASKIFENIEVEPKINVIDLLKRVVDEELLSKLRTLQYPSVRITNPSPNSHENERTFLLNQNITFEATIENLESRQDRRYSYIWYKLADNNKRDRIGIGWVEDDKVTKPIKVTTIISASHKKLGTGTHSIIFTLIDREETRYFPTEPVIIHIIRPTERRVLGPERKALPSATTPQAPQSTPTSTPLEPPESNIRGGQSTLETADLGQFASDLEALASRLEPLSRRDKEAIDRMI